MDDHEITQLTHGAYVTSDDLHELASRAEAVTRLIPYAAVCRRTAAYIWGLDALPPGQDEDDWRIELVVPQDRDPPKRPGLIGYQAHLPPEDVTVYRGIRITSPERTAIDCARWLPRHHAVAVLDQFRRKGMSRQTMFERAAQLKGERIIRRARDAIAVADAGADSPPESWARVYIIDCGLPTPRAQIPVPGPYGETFFIDMGSEEFRAAVEYDGEEHHTLARDRRHDDRRRRWLESKGWNITPIRGGDLFGDPRPFLTSYLTHLIAGGWDPRAGYLEEVAQGIRRIRRAESE